MQIHTPRFIDFDDECAHADLMAALGTPDTCQACSAPCSGPHCPDCAACIARDAAREVTFWAALTIVGEAIKRINAGAAVAYTRQLAPTGASRWA